MRVAVRASELGIEDEKTFWKWMRAAFAQKRKTLVNNWKALCAAERLRQTMAEQGISDRARAEELSLEQLAELFRAATSGMRRGAHP
jgi:16S rRNA (adenine1518-N6/adenine1519-N6)-dimethyltransferase